MKLGPVVWLMDKIFGPSLSAFIQRNLIRSKLSKKKTQKKNNKQTQIQTTQTCLERMFKNIMQSTPSTYTFNC